MDKSHTTTKEMMINFDDLPDQKGNRWTPEADIAVLKYWRIKRHQDFTEAFSKRFFKTGERTLYARYQKLINQEKES